MKQIIPHLYVCSIVDYEALGPAILRYSVLGCAKEPLHRRFAKLDGASEDGYTTRSMDKSETEYLYAERSHALYLNMVDAREPRFFSKELFDKALDFIDKEIKDGRDVLIVCNKGESRSPTIAMLYLVKNGELKDIEFFDELTMKFAVRYYSEYKPGLGIYLAAQNYWKEYL